MSNLPVSPITGQPSKLRAFIERSVGMGSPVAETQPAHVARSEPDVDRQILQQQFQAGVYSVQTPNLRAIVRRSVGIVDQPQQRAQVQRAEVTGSDLALAQAEIVARRVIQGLNVLIDRLDRIDQRISAQPVERASYAQPDTWRAAVRQSGVRNQLDLEARSHVIPLAPTGDGRSVKGVERLSRL